MPARLVRHRPPRLKQIGRQREQAHYKTSDWRAKRDRILVRDAFQCANCRRVTFGPSANVDHIVPLEDGGSDADDNLQVLCRSCHGRKTRKEQKTRGV